MTQMNTDFWILKSVFICLICVIRVPVIRWLFKVQKNYTVQECDATKAAPIP